MEREAAGGEFPSPIVSVELVDDKEMEVVSSMRKAAAVAALKIGDALAATPRPFLGPSDRCCSR